MVEWQWTRNECAEGGDAISMKHSAFLIACALPLAACGNQPQVSATNASTQDVAEKVAAAGGTEAFVRPGKWASTVTLDEMSAPGMPQGATAQMKQVMASAHTVESCLTPKEAKKPDPNFFSGRDNGCRYDKFTMAGGKIDMTMRCSGGHAMGKGSTMHMSGSYAPEEYHMAMENRTDTGTSMGMMVMKMHVDAKRVGECTGNEG
jgi:hypothetical protein